MSTDQLKKGDGCSVCNHTGYRGRMAIHETLLVDEEMRQMITSKKPDTAYRKYVTEKGFQSMFTDGLVKAAQGLTTLEEVYRVTTE